jgi:energy-coupling factor transport system substrate-specific component
MTPRHRWSTRDLLLVAAVGAVFGVVFRFFGLFHGLYSNALGKVFGEWDYGIWFMAGLLGAVILQRPGAALAAETLAGGLSLLLGSEWGIDVLWSAVIQGLACEIVFALGGWKRFGPGVMMGAGALAGAAAFAHDYVVYQYGGYLPWIKVGLALTMMISGALLGGLGSRALALSVARTGAIDQTALGREQQRQAS